MGLAMPCVLSCMGEGNSNILGHELNLVPHLQVGAGREGAVAVALDLETQELVAIKKVLNLFRHTSFTQMVRNEIKVMDLLKGSGEAPSFTAATLRSIPLHNQRALRTCPAADPTAHVLFWGHGFEAAMKPVCSLVLQRM